MKQYKGRSTVAPAHLETCGNIIYEYTNITPFSEEIDGRLFEGYEYDCTEYSINEYLMKLTNENVKLKSELIDTQLALVELYEGGLDNG